MSLSVCTIVLNWNKLYETEETLRCLLEQDYQNHAIILVDNNSDRIINETLKLKFPEVIFIDNEKNLGYTGGNNVGIRYALNKGADIIIIANNDIYIEDKQLVSKVVKTFQKYEDKIFILGPEVRFYNNRDIIQEAGATFFYSEGDKVRLNDYILNKVHLSDSIKYYDGASGAFLIVKRKVFEKIGLFDEKIYMYCDETDFCYRAWVAGFQVAVDSSLKVYHKSSKLKNYINPYISYYITRNSFYFLRKHKKTISNYKYFNFKLYRDLLSKIYNNLRNYRKEKKFLFAVLKGFIDAKLNKMSMNSKTVPVEKK